MKTFHLLLVLSLTGAVLLAGCAGDDGGSESTGGGDSGRELNTDVSIGGDASTNTTDDNSTTNTTTSG